MVAYIPFKKVLAHIKKLLKFCIIAGRTDPTRQYYARYPGQKFWYMFGLIYNIMNTQVEQGNVSHILMCEDDKDQSFFFQLLLKKEYPHIRLTIMDNGNDLLPVLLDSDIDLIILDLHMPCRSGFDCLKEIKNSRQTEHIPVIVYSSSTNLNDIRRAYLEKADFYMVKPVNNEELHSEMELILSTDWKNDASVGQHYFENNHLVPIKLVA